MLSAGAAVKVELIVNGESREPVVLTDDRKLLSELPIRDNMILTAKLCQANSNTASSPESSSDSSTSSPQHPYDGPNLEAENVLPGVVSVSERHVPPLMYIALLIIFIFISVDVTKE